jgi:hypothetical protein
MVQLNELGVALRERLNVLETLWLEKNSNEIVHQLYTDETEITGAETDELYSGTGALRELVALLVADTCSAAIRIDRLRPLASDVVYTWVTWDLESKHGEPFNMKSLFIWKRQDQGWRIVADMYAGGVIPA